MANMAPRPGRLARPSRHNYRVSDSEDWDGCAQNTLASAEYYQLVHDEHDLRFALKLASVLIVIGFIMGAVGHQDILNNFAEAIMDGFK